MDPYRPPTFLKCLFFLFTAFAAVVANDLNKRDTIVSGGQTWSSVGCFTDISVGRTLAGDFFSDNTNMTVESCIAFCRAQNFIFAGVEFGHECYCDSTIQFPGTPAPLPTDCNFACSGNSSETCGASGRIEIFTNGKTAPVLVENVPNSAWAYQGCFTDSAESRVLGMPMAVPVGVTAETCTAACQTAGFTDAGLEDGRECWCDSTLGTSSTHVSDLDCRAVCDANHTEYCGNANRIALYHLFDNEGSGSSQSECIDQDVSNFTLVARYNTPPPNGSPQEVPLKIVLVEMVPSVTWGLLSACPLCCSDWPSFSMKDSVFLPHSLSNPGQLMVSTAPGSGESPNFVASSPAFLGFQSYCVMNGTRSTTTDNGSGSIIPQKLLGFGGKSDAFSLCANNTINGRLDVVFEPVTSHPHYTLDDCSPVTIEIVT